MKHFIERLKYEGQVWHSCKLEFKCMTSQVIIIQLVLVVVAWSQRMGDEPCGDRQRPETILTGGAGNVGLAK